MAILITLGTFLLMECITWLTHKYVMHGFLWALHKDHHNPNHNHILERNDLFFIIFSIPSITLFAIGGFNQSLWYLFYVGLGILLYGIAYFLVHDIFIHQRLKWLTRTNNFYFRALRKAHKIHHKHLNKCKGECFGMLWVPLKYFKEALKSN